MKTSRTYAFLISLMVVCFSAGLVLVMELIDLRYRFLEYVLFGGMVAGGTFLIVRLFFIRFVENKINPILETIQSYTPSKRKLRKHIDRGDV
jgi:hypothetical protein